jgi:hypothetical protein
MEDFPVADSFSLRAKRSASMAISSPSLLRYLKQFQLCSSGPADRQLVMDGDRRIQQG